MLGQIFVEGVENLLLRNCCSRQARSIVFSVSNVSLSSANIEV
jgi:hypothetical protein